MRILICILTLTSLIGCHTKQENLDGKSPVALSIGWEYADSLLSKISRVQIPIDTFHLYEFNITNDHSIIQQAIDQTDQRGGGTLVIPAGIYLSGPIQLKTRVDLHLKEGAEIRFIADPGLYPLKYNWFGGYPCMNYSPMIYANNGTDIKISGKGTINGQGYETVWKKMKFNDKADWELLRELDKEGVNPINRKFGTGHSLRPDLIAFIECTRVNISGLNIINAPYWSVHPVLTSDLTIENCTINSQGYDQIGVALESSNDVLIENNYFESVADGIKILSGRTEIPGNRPSQNILIRQSRFNNILYSPIIISSNTYAGVNKVFISDIEIDSTEMVFRVYGGRKGPIKNIFLKDFSIDRVYGQVFYGRISKADEGPAIISDIHMEGFDVRNSARSFIVSGHSKNFISNVSITNSTFEAAKGSYIKNMDNFSISNTNENGSEINGNYHKGDNEIPRIELDGNEDDILDSDDIQLDEVPELVKQTVESEFPLMLITDIDRIITSNNAIYDINLEPETDLDIEVLVQLDGKVLRKKEDITYADLPEKVLSALGNHLKTETNPFMMNSIKKVTYHDLTYYELKGEAVNKLFAISITENGESIEEKQKLITTYFSAQNIEN